MSGYDPTTTGITFFITLAMLVLVFLVFRAIVLWYWRVNRIVNLLEELLEASTKGSGAIDRLAARMDLAAEAKTPTPPWEAGKRNP